MSYILSALRKAEAERNGATAAAGTAMPLRSLPGQAPKTRAGLAVAIAAGLLILVLGGYYYIDDKNSAVGFAVQGGTPPEAVQSAENHGVESNNSATKVEPVNTETAVQSGATVAATTEVHQPQATIPPAKPVEAVAPQALPALNITGYIYFEDKPENSKLFVEGIVYRRHSRLAEGLILEGFYPDHVVVSYRGVNQEIKIP